jgi:hypothetical protein
MGDCILCSEHYYSKPSRIWIKWGERSSRLMKQKIALKDKKKLRKQINGKYNNTGGAVEYK